MKLVEEMTTEELVERLSGISRQRVSQLMIRFAKRKDFETMRKIRDAKLIIKARKKGIDSNIEINHTAGIETE